MYFICCKILGVSPGADEDTIRAAYRKAAKELHPDVNDSEKAGEYFIILKNAYEFLLSHKYSDGELEILWHQEQVRRRKQEAAASMDPQRILRKRSIERFTLKDVLKQSRLARVIYLTFHVLFIFVGIWLLFHSLYDIFSQEPGEGVNRLSAYSTVFFGFMMGVVFLSTFLITGISYLRNRQ
ncbi:MAG: J domain-containing protein [Bacteroidales bacterium]|nr:J domain-containing protein [Bacteroidales bacterium]